MLYSMVDMDSLSEAERQLVEAVEAGSECDFSQGLIQPGDIADWIATFAGAFTSAIAPEEHDAYVAEVREALRPTLQGPDGAWTADYVRLRFRAERP